MKNLLTTILLAVLIFIICIGVILLIAVGLEYVMAIIDAKILVYAETYFILALFMLLINLVMPKTK